MKDPKNIYKIYTEKLNNDLWVHNMIQMTNIEFYPKECQTHKALMMLVGINRVIQQTEDLEYKSFCEIQFNELKHKL